MRMFPRVMRRRSQNAQVGCLKLDVSGVASAVVDDFDHPELGGRLPDALVGFYLGVS